jgi:hypothetical protein
MVAIRSNSAYFREGLQFLDIEESFRIMEFLDFCAVVYFSTCIAFLNSETDSPPPIPTYKTKPQ